MYGFALPFGKHLPLPLEYANQGRYLALILVFIFNFSYSQTISEQTIVRTIVPTGWTINAGTTDISNKTVATTSGIGGGGNKWIQTPGGTANYTLPVPPTVSLLIDSDGDGIADIFDLDSDNDGILDTVECPPSELVTNGTFTGNTTGWTLGNWSYSGGSVINETNGNNSTLSQSINNLDKAAYGTVSVSFTLGAQDGSNSAGSTASLDVILNGVIYATFNNSTVRNITTNNVTLSLSNGATATFSPFSTAAATGYTTQNVVINIPYTGPSTATLGFRMISGNDDWSLDNISILGMICDTDGDGIPNYLDLDSDGDGCPDAVEGAGNFTASQLTTASGAIASQSPNQNFGTAVDANGIPATVGAGGQGIGQSQDASKNDCKDSDGDGVPDWADLDNDNDGILDANEGYACGKAPIPTTVPTSTHIMNYNFTDYSGIKGFNFKLTSTGNSARWASPANDFNLNGIDPYTNGSKVTYEFDLPVENFKFWVGDLDNKENVNVNFYDENGVRITNLLPFSRVMAEVTAGSTTLTTDAAYGVKISTTRANGPDKGIQNYVEIYKPGVLISKVEATYLGTNGFSPEYHIGNMCTKRDTDGDRIPDYLDLDSDGDGCPDAIEGGASFTSSNLVSSSMPGGNSGAGYTGTSVSPVVQNLGNTVGNTPTTMGVPTIAGTGQAIGDSQNGAVSSQCPVCNAGTTQVPLTGSTLSN